ncbi:MAG: hypothetical protein IJT64_07110 [Kiritimatiellae bacterium]|nr:hypothetical protein [Kiritimatiellia bacterium]
MKKVVLIMAGAMACAGIAMAAPADAITVAAKDPAKIPALAKDLGGQPVSQFAADVISAIGAMPGSPSHKTRKMAEAAEAFLGTSKDGDLASLLASLVANVSPASLPAWVNLFKPACDDFTKGLSDAAHSKLVNDVMAKINALADTSDADKTVISCFALKLLARSTDPADTSAWVAKVAIPAAYADQVKAAMPGVFAGDYSAVLGPGTKVVKDLSPLHPVNVDLMTDDALNKKYKPIIPSEDKVHSDRLGVDRPEPVGVPPPPPPTPGRRRPPVPQPYKGQN